MHKPHMLVIADAVAPTGFARFTHNLLDRLQPDWLIRVLGINYRGDPHPYPYQIYPAAIGMQHSFGYDRTAPLVEALNPDVILVQQDAWNIEGYMQEIRKVNEKVPVVAFIPPDAPNQPHGRMLNGLTHLVTPTQFGMQELRKGGYVGAGSVIPYGVDTAKFYPIDQRTARINAGYKEHMLDAFVVGRADRNASRKRYDLSTRYWAEWWHSAGRPEDAYLYYHCSLQDRGWDILQLADYYGIEGRLLLTAMHLDPGIMVPEHKLLSIYNSWDGHISTALGEGWGLVTHETAACGKFQILPRSSALAEWMDEAAWFVDCTSTAATTGGPNTLGQIADQNQFVEALSYFYRIPREREQWGQMAYNRAIDPRFQWNTIAQQFDAVLRGVMAL